MGRSAYRRTSVEAHLLNDPNAPWWRLGLDPTASLGECLSAVPWCETCDRFYNPESLAPDGTCATCGRFIADPSEDTEDTKIPWHFWVLVAALVLYLGWRLLEVIIWAVTGDWP